MIWRELFKLSLAFCFEKQSTNGPQPVERALSYATFGDGGALNLEDEQRRLEQSGNRKDVIRKDVIVRRSRRVEFNAIGEYLEMYPECVDPTRLIHLGAHGREVAHRTVLHGVLGDARGRSHDIVHVGWT